jgi:hypothetical protein
MSPQPYIDVTGATAYREATGSGTLADPYVPEFSLVRSFAATSTITNVASSATSITLSAANNNRKTIIIVNDSDSNLYVVLNASTASTTNYSIFLPAKIESTPSFVSFNGEDYLGEIRGVWSSANGFARITEIV